MTKAENCPFFRKCGGCKYFHDDYAYSVRQKQKQVNELLKPFGQVYPVLAMEDPFRYRNKAIAQVRYDFRKGQLFSGKYAAGSHKVAKINDCIIEDVKANQIINEIVKLMKSFKYEAYDEDNGRGLIRHIVVRNNQKQDQYMVTLVVSDPRFPSKKNFVKVITEKFPEIKAIVLNVNNRKTSAVLGDREEIIYGKGGIVDRLLGLDFVISSKSFYQVNPRQTEHIYQKAIALANLKPTDRVLDAYCGIGTIGMVMAPLCKEVIGVELNADAVKDAIRNAKFNKVENIRFYRDDASDFIGDYEDKLDVVIMDPPRSGSDERFLSTLVKKGIKKIVYVSCNPESLARDIQYLREQGYKNSAFYPIDNFPFTDHIETVVLMSRL